MSNVQLLHALVISYPIFWIIDFARHLQFYGKWFARVCIAFHINRMWKISKIFVVSWILFFNFWRTHVLFVGPLIPQFRTSGDVCPGFQSQGGYHLHTFLSVRYSSDSPLVWHLPTSWWPAWWPIAFPTCISRGRMLGFERGISRSEHRRSTHSAIDPLWMNTGLYSTNFPDSVFLNGLEMEQRTINMWRLRQRFFFQFYFVVFTVARARAMWMAPLVTMQFNCDDKKNRSRIVWTDL